MAILVPVAAAGFAARPAYRAFREHRIEKTLETAQEAERLEDWQAARDRSRSVLMMRNGNYKAFRILARSLAKTEDPAAYVAAVVLIRHPESTRDDRVEALETLAKQGPAALALGAYAYLDTAEKKGRDAELNAAITPALILMGSKAISAAQQGLIDFMPDNPSPRVRLALVRASTAAPNPERVSIARQQFAALIEEGSGSEALEALELLGNTSGGLAPGKPLPNLRNWVSQQPQAKVIHHLLALHPEIAEDPAGKEALFQDAINRFASLDPAATARWLNLHGKSEDALKILDGPAKERSDAYLARIHALLRLKRETELAEALKNPPAAADQMEVEIVRAVLAKNHGDRATAEASWTAALDQASYDTRRNRFITVARAAELYREPGTAADAWMAAVRMEFGNLPMYASLAPSLAVLYKEGRSEEMLAMSQSMLKFEPSNIDLVNNTLYLGLLHHSTKPDEVIQLLEKALEKEPDKVELNSTLILADLLAGDPQKAMSRLPTIGDCKRVSTPTKQVLQAIALKMMGDEKNARELYDRIDKSTFLPQEMTIFAHLMDGKKNEEKTEEKTEDLSLAEWEEKKSKLSSAEVPAWKKGLERAEQNRKSADESQGMLPELRVPGLADSSKAFDNQTSVGPSEEN